MINGLIVKAIAGFCYVEAGNTVYECKPRGFFRKDNISPVAGDRVTISLNGDKGVIESIYERKNYLVRPPLANIDKLFIVSSCSIPTVNTLLIDRMVAICEYKNITPVIVFNKADLGGFGELPKVYSEVGYKTFVVSAETGEGIDAIRSELSGCISAFSGNSGVGKSSILNHIIKIKQLSTGEVSEKLGRGKHTTRQAELFNFGDGYVADTPGFSTLQLTEFMLNDKDELKFCFKEFYEHFGKCRFSSCTHINEPGCSVINYVKYGKIAASRHDSYVTMFNDLKKIKSWELKK